MKQTKKNLAVLIAICLMFTMMPMMAFASEEDVFIETLEADNTLPDEEPTTEPDEEPKDEEPETGSDVKASVLMFDGDFPVAAAAVNTMLASDDYYTEVAAEAADTPTLAICIPVDDLTGGSFTLTVNGTIENIAVSEALNGKIEAADVSGDLKITLKEGVTSTDFPESRFHEADIVVKIDGDNYGVSIVAAVTWDLEITGAGTVTFQQEGRAAFPLTATPAKQGASTLENPVTYTLKPDDNWVTMTIGEGDDEVVITSFDLIEEKYAVPAIFLADSKAVKVTVEFANVAAAAVAPDKSVTTYDTLAKALTDTAVKEGSTVHVLTTETEALGTDITISKNLTITGAEMSEDASKIRRPLLNLNGHTVTINNKAKVTFEDNTAKHIMYGGTIKLDDGAALNISQNNGNTMLWNISELNLDNGSSINVSDNRGIGINGNIIADKKSTVTVSNNEAGHGITGTLDISGGSSVTVSGNDYCGITVEKAAGVRVSDDSTVRVTANKQAGRPQDKELATNYTGGNAIAAGSKVTVNGETVTELLALPTLAAKSGSNVFTVEDENELEIPNRYHVYVVQDQLDVGREIVLSAANIASVDKVATTDPDRLAYVNQVDSVTMTGGAITVKLKAQEEAPLTQDVQPQITANIDGVDYEILIYAVAEFKVTTTGEGAGTVTITYAQTNGEEVASTYPRVITNVKDVKITAAADSNSTLKSVTVKDALGKDVYDSGKVAAESKTYDVNVQFDKYTPPGSGGRGGGSGKSTPEEKKPEEPDPGTEVTKKTFTDVAAGAWYAEAVNYVVEQGLFAGMTDTEFGPEVNMSRAMFVTVLGRLAENMGFSTTGHANSFSDVAAGQYYTKYVSWGNANGIIAGYDATTFGTNDNVTREQMAVLFVKFAEYAKVTLKTDSAKTFPDASNISSWAVDSVEKATAAGLISGHDDGTFQPRGTATRAQVAVVFMNFAKSYGDAAGTVTDATDDTADDAKTDDAADQTDDSKTK